MFLNTLSSRTSLNRTPTFQVAEIVGKGRGVLATKHFAAGDFVVEYKGELVTRAVAVKRETAYADGDTDSCYMFYFTSGGRQLWYALRDDHNL